MELANPLSVGPYSGARRSDSLPGYAEETPRLLFRVLVPLDVSRRSLPESFAMEDEDLITNLREAKFECTYGRGCNGICCQNGRPFVYLDEAERIDANLDKFLPHLRSEARTLVEKQGYLSARRKFGYPAVRVVKGWCVFFNQGCVLQKIGATEGDKFRYKPAVCALFPLERDAQDRWYVRQQGFKREQWDLFCLDPSASEVPAAASLQAEIALARRFTGEEEEGS